jgi:hypothetical protein
MRKLLITLSGAEYGQTSGGVLIAGSWVGDTLDDGAIACFESDGTLIDPAIPVVSTSEVYFGLGRTTYGLLTSTLIDRTSLVYNKYAYLAPRAKVMVHGDDGTTGNELAFPTIVAGQTYGYTITDNSQPIEKTSRMKTYSVTAVTGDTDNTILARLIAAINADTARVCNAAVINGDDGVSFTGITAGVDFKAVPYADMKTLVTGMLVEGNGAAGACTSAIIDGVFYNASTTVTLAVKYGHTPLLLVQSGYVGEGTATAIAATEKDYSTEQGNINAWRMINELWKVTSRVVTGQTYTCYVIEWITPNQSVNIGQLDGNAKQTLVLAVPSGDAAAILAIDTVLAAL